MKKFYISFSIFVCLLVAAAFISCSPRPADSLRHESVPIGDHVFSREEISQMLLTNGIIASFSLTDAQYVAPTLEWVEKEYSDKLSKFLFDYNLHHWTKESSDCDDISRAAAVQASILFHNSKTRPKGVGFLFGEFHYIKSQAGGHALNIIIVKDKEDYKLVFYEPQLKYIISTSGNERLLTIFGRF